MPVIPTRGSPRTRPQGASQPSASRGAATSACAKSTRISTRLTKNRSTRPSSQARSSFARYADAIVVLCARYQARPVGCLMKSRVALTPGVRGSPGRPKARAEASQVSREVTSLTAPPPRAARRRAQRSGSAARAQLPSHETPTPLAEREVAAVHPDRDLVQPPQELQPRRRVVPDTEHPLVGVPEPSRACHWQRSQALRAG